MKNHMKAESIEQIREHLARGGRVLARNDDRNGEWEAIEFFDGYLVLDVNGVRFYCPVDRVKPEGWELVPIEEEKKDNDDSLKPCPFCGGDADAMTYCGNDTIFCKTCHAMMGGEESRATREELAEAWNRRPIEEEKRPEWFRDSQKERMQRIHQSLLFGHYPAMNDLIDWWQATTGERIEWGRRCNACECSGSFNVYGKTVHCIMCNGSGYTVRPTWMGERKATGDDDPGTM